MSSPCFYLCDILTPCAQVSVLRSERAAANTLQGAVKCLEGDKAQLQERVRSLEKSIAAAQKSSPAAQPSGAADTVPATHVGSPALDEMREAKETAECQVLLFLPLSPAPLSDLSKKE